jgi:flavin reductase (DIM6/NTAB) family NADH-FMN oxidoreductase RutF
MNQTSAPLPRGISEFTHAELTPAPSRLVKPPRVLESPAALECVVTEIVALKNRQGAPAGALLVIGEVVGVHLDDRLVADGRFDTAAAKPIARCGYQDYAVVKELFSIVRPPGAGQ